MTAQAPHNLPIQLTSFIGREQELAELGRLLGKTRLLTLTGAGGSGKTRLALEVAGEQRERFAGGAWLVELAALADPALIPATVATVLGVHEEQGRPVLATLLDWLRERQLLLILDNCEHLIAGCAAFADAVLHAGRETRILATSREALGITGESAYQVPALQTPNPTQALGPEQLKQYAAVRLFVERATQALASFRLSAANAPAVALICQRLDGMPLAIELAAARVRALHVEQIAARLDDRFRLLTGGSRTALPRQQTLRGTLDWSYELLAPAERVLLRRLSIFAGGWTLEAAEDITKDEIGRMKDEPIPPSAPFVPPQTGFNLPPSEVLDLLTHLVDKSLVQLDEQAAEPRYRMLETIRQYAREKLLDAGELEPLRDRHLDFYRRLGERAWLSSVYRGEWTPRVEAELDNLRAAFDRACEVDLEGARMLAGSLVHFWYLGAHMQEALSWYERVLRTTAPATVTKGMALALFGAGYLYGFLLALDDAESYLKQSIALWRTLDDNFMLVRSLQRLCLVKIHQGKSEAACAIYEAHESLFRQAGDPMVLAHGLYWWGLALMAARSDFAGARRLIEESISLVSQRQDPRLVDEYGVGLGYLATAQGDFVAARRFNQQALNWQRQGDPTGELALTLGRVADIAFLQGDYAAARRLHEEAIAMFRSFGDVAHTAHIAISLGYVAVEQEELAEAECLLAEGLAIARQGQFQLSLARGLGGYAHLRLAQGNAEQAARLMGTAIVATHTRTSHIPADRIKHGRTLDALRAQLGESRFAELAAEGYAWSLEQALAEAERTAPDEPAAPAPVTKETFGGLTPREREVAALLARGESSRAIAAQLVLSERTVENHTANILSKLGFRSRTQVAAWALKNGLTKSPS